MSETSYPLKDALVLLADPDPVRRGRLRRALEGAGARVTETATLQATLRLLQGGRWSAIVSATRFPEGRGTQGVRAARFHHPAARRVLLADDLDFEEAVMAINEGRVHAIVRHADDARVVVEASFGLQPAAGSGPRPHTLITAA